MRSCACARLQSCTTLVRACVGAVTICGKGMLLKRVPARVGQSQSLRTHGVALARAAAVSLETQAQRPTHQHAIGMRILQLPADAPPALERCCTASFSSLLCVIPLCAVPTTSDCGLAVSADVPCVARRAAMRSRGGEPSMLTGKVPAPAALLREQEYMDWLNQNTHSLPDVPPQGATGLSLCLVIYTNTCRAVQL